MKITLIEKQNNNNLGSVIISSQTGTKNVKRRLKLHSPDVCHSEEGTVKGVFAKLFIKRPHFSWVIISIHGNINSLRKEHHPLVTTVPPYQEILKHWNVPLFSHCHCNTLIIFKNGPVLSSFKMTTHVMYFFKYRDYPTILWASSLPQNNFKEFLIMVDFLQKPLKYCHLLYHKGPGQLEFQLDQPWGSFKIANYVVYFFKCWGYPTILWVFSLPQNAFSRIPHHSRFHVKIIGTW